MISREIDKTAKKKMRRMLDTWKDEKSESFTVGELKRVLAKEVTNKFMVICLCGNNFRGCMIC